MKKKLIVTLELLPVPEGTGACLLCYLQDTPLCKDTECEYNKYWQVIKIKEK